VSAVGDTEAVVEVNLSYVTVTVLGSAVVASLGNAVALVEAAPACFLVSVMASKEPPELTTDNATLGFNEY
jgi:hypothetical protein